MKNFRICVGMTLAVCAMAVFSACGSSDKAAKPQQKGIVLVEGDNATVTTSADGKFTVIEFPAQLTEADKALYKTDLTSYLLNSNAPISSDGSEYNRYSAYYYMHNSREWLHKGQYENATQIEVSKIKSISIANRSMRLREFYTLMPLKSNSRDMKNSQSFQDEIRDGQSFYTYIDILLRD